MKITWLGHSAFHIQTDGKDILVDPFFTGNPSFPEGYEDTLTKVDIIALTHGHGDHFGDTLRLAKAYDATVVAMYEIVQYLGAQGLEKLEPMNIGGSIVTGGIKFSMVNAQHSSAIIEDGKPITMGDPAGLVITSSEHAVYHAGDTGLFSDMQLIQRVFRPDIGILPIGDRFTMDPEQAAIACNEFLDLKLVLPCHYGTWPLVPGDPQQFKSLVNKGEVRIPGPGETIDV
ncbi:metal-dependent hydrolase [Fodinicurvata sp. EGI_FJ10296]|uniref:metal-dependent hydrolase n=1 Tax=Fodinicurvata sp. EGI_FJ10296 TaxID=3231908 RepID=UPI0034567504